MAVSLALNWNLPASTPLFDNEDSFTKDGQGSSLQSASSSGTSPTPQTYSAVASQTSTSPSNADAHTSTLSKSTSASELREVASNDQSAGGGKSYAAIASTPPSFPQMPVPSYRGAGLSGQPNYGNLNANPGLTSNTSWSGAAQTREPTPAAKAHVSEDGRRIRSTSGPQRPSHLTYNDTLQHYPGPAHFAYALQSNRSGLPPGAMKPNTLPQMSSNPSLSGTASGYHPYRRTTKTSDVVPQQATNLHGSAPLFASQSESPILPRLESVMPARPERARSSSVSSSGTAREAAAAAAHNFAAPSLATYSSVVSSGAGAPLSRNAVVSPNGESASSRPLGPSRQSSVSSVDPSLPRQVDPSASTESFGATGSTNGRSRVNSNSSQASASLADGQRTQAAALSAVNGSRTNAIGRKPLSSPLSRSGPVGTDEDGIANSDDENTIGGRTTPTPGDKAKKGFSGKLRKALSLSTLQQVEAAAAAPDRAYGGRTNVSTRRPDGSHFPHSSAETNGSSGSTRSTSPPQTPDNGVPLPGSSGASISSRKSTRPPISGSEGTSKRSLFNRKFNSSTDNISISSTVSSASMMLRKVGNLGKLARRSNIMGLTNMFNKEKEDGRAGVHTDDFGTLPRTSSDLDTVSSSAGRAGGTASKKGQKTKKGSPAVASVSHATVELETPPSKVIGSGDMNMTPAASYVRQHQLQMRAEAERLAREKAEAERQALKSRSKTKTTDDVTEGRQKMIEKEKERLKSVRGWRRRLVGSLGSTSQAAEVTGLETVPLHEPIPVEQGSQPAPVVGAYHVPPGSTAAQPQLGNSINQFNETSFDSTFDEDDLTPPHMPGANEGYESGDDFETDSLRHWGEGIERSRESAAKIRSVKGILKNTPSFQERASNIQQQYNEAGAAGSSTGTPEKPGAGRLRANSYDAPHNTSHPTSSVPLMSHISTSASTDRVDGVARPSEEEKSSRHSGGDASIAGTGHGSNIGHHPNSSLPTLSLMMNPAPLGQRSVTAPVSRKRLVFADAHIYHSTWPAHVYDRRGELATCNRLTPLLAQRIKEELNTYKMEEMAVAPSSRIHTHFFV